jgi:hypothetical protein
MHLLLVLLLLQQLQVCAVHCHGVLRHDGDAFRNAASHCGSCAL